MIYFQLGDDMNKKLIPTYTYKNVYCLDINKIKRLGYKTILIDLDNTLASPYVYDPDSKVFEFINSLKVLDFNVVILSNNHEERVKRFVTPLEIKYLFEVKKPSIKKVNKFLLENNICKEECIMIGDQIMTDVLMANKLDIDVILMEPLTIKDEPITFIPRLLDKFFRNKIIKKKLAEEL